MASTTLVKLRMKKQPWITYEILDLCNKRRVLNSSKKTNPDLKEEYMEINIIIHKLYNCPITQIVIH